MSRWKPMVTMVAWLAVVGCKTPEPAPKKEPEQTADPAADKALEKAKELVEKGLECFAEGDLEGAKQAGEDALMLKADLKEANDLLARVELERTEKTEKKEAEASERKRRVAALLGEARKLADGEDYAEAQAKLEDLLRLDSDNVEASALVDKVKELEAAKGASLERARKVASMRKEAARLVAAREWERAEHLCSQVVKLSHTQREKAEALNRAAHCKAMRLYELGREALEEGQYAKAVSYLGESLDARKLFGVDSLLARAVAERRQEEQRLRDQKRFDALMSGARALEAEDKLGEAIQRYQQAVQLTSVGQEVSEAKEALDNLEEELKYREHIRQAEAALALAEPDYAGAISEFFKAEQLRGELPPELQEKARGAMFWVCTRQGDEAMEAGNHDEAILAYEEALACREDETVAARKAAAEARKAAHDFAALVVEAQGLFEQKNEAEAVDPLQRAVSIAEERPEFIDTDDLDGARNDLKRAEAARRRRLDAELADRWRETVRGYRRIASSPGDALVYLSLNRDAFAGSRYERSIDKLIAKVEKRLRKSAAREWALVRKEIGKHPEDRATNAQLLRNCLDKVSGVEEYEARILDALREEEQMLEGVE